MSESRPTISSSMRRIVLPLLVALVLVAGTLLISGSALIRIEDVTANRILAGTYGTPDWRVQEMNPLLAQLVSLLYRVIPAVNWYGVMLLALLFVAAAAGISLAARKKGGLIPAIIIVSPVVILLTNSMISTAVCALCAAVGAFSLFDGLSRGKEGIGRTVVGIVLFIFGAMLSILWAAIIGVCAVLCWLPGAVREERLRKVLLGLLILAVSCLALFGYQALMYGSPELSAYRSNYALYESLQHSSLKDESDRLMTEYGMLLYSEEHAGHDHDGDGIPDGEGHIHEEDEIESNVFDSVGWTLNDASLFFSRYSADDELLNPEVLRKLNDQGSHWDFTPSRLFGELFETIKKPQFLMLIALFVVGALAVLITSRRRGLVVLLAAVFAFGGHVLMVAHYYNSFADIAPFYLAAIAVLLFAFNGEDAKAWYQRVLSAPWLRIGVTALVAVVFVAAVGGLLYYTRITPANASIYIGELTEYMKPYIAEHTEYLFIGENPYERYKPDTLVAPARGENETLLAGSYDLYSPRRAALKERFNVTNPLLDSVDNSQVAYVLIGFPEGMAIRLSDHYGIYSKEGSKPLEIPDFAEGIVHIAAFTQEELDQSVADAKEAEEQAAMWAEALADLEAQGFFDDLEDDHDHDEDETGQAATPDPASATASPSPAP